MSNTLPTNAAISILPRNRAVPPVARLRVQLVVPSGAMERISGTGNIIDRHLYDDSGQTYRRNDEITILAIDGRAAPDIVTLFVESVETQPDPLGYVHCLLTSSNLGQ